MIESQQIIHEQCPICQLLESDIDDCPICNGTGYCDNDDLAMFWLEHTWKESDIVHVCITCGVESGGVPWGPRSHYWCSYNCTPLWARKQFIEEIRG